MKIEPELFQEIGYFILIKNFNFYFLKIKGSTEFRNLSTSVKKLLPLVLVTFSIGSIWRQVFISDELLNCKPNKVLLRNLHNEYFHVLICTQYILSLIVFLRNPIIYTNLLTVSLLSFMDMLSVFPYKIEFNLYLFVWEAWNSMVFYDH